jgi:predicted O-methyltransferase YrrM
MSYPVHYQLHIDESKFNNSRVFSGRIHLLKHCFQFLRSNSICAEVGVAEGYFSEKILEIINPSKLYLIDAYNHTAPEHTSANHYSYILKKFQSNSVVSLKKGMSWDMLNTLDSNSLDYIYIDADHSYESVKKDIESAYRVVKSGGVIQFNDYTTYSPVENMRYGVLHAVNEFLQKYSPEILGISLDKDGYNDIAIRLFKH